MTTETLAVSLPTALPIEHQADVMVIGGGPGGIGAAVAAARQGADTLLVEHYGFLGGMATAGEVNPFMPNHVSGESLDTGIFEEWLDRIDHYGGKERGTRVFDPNCARLAAEDLCTEAGVRLLYHHRVAHAETEGRQITGVALHCKSGLVAARAKQYIDCTGDGDLAALAGCAFAYGSEESGAAQPMTLCFKLKLDPVAAPEAASDKDLYKLVRQDHFEHIQDVYRKAQADGRTENPRENVLMFRGVAAGVVHFNTTRVTHHSSINGSELSDAEQIARRQLRQLVNLLREEVPIFKGCEIYSIAPQIGIRESRRITGRAYVTMDDYTAGRTFPDAVARVNYPVDIHNPDGTGTLLIHMPADAWYEIPFGCLLARDIDNLGVGSRCISVDHGVHSSVRVMPPVCSLGQAIGTAAGMAIKNETNICNIDPEPLRASLIAQGRNLLPYDPDRPAPRFEPEHAERIDKINKQRAAVFSA